MRTLDIVIPVYNEGANIISVLGSLRKHVRTQFRVLICFDRYDDDTLTALTEHPQTIPITLVKNRGRGAFDAVVTGFEASTSPYVLVFPADDDYNAPQIDKMVDAAEAGAQIVVASRFMPGGRMVGCPWLKKVLIRSSAWTLYNLAGLPVRDASNGLRLFSQCALRSIPLESSVGFTYSIELLVKAHRLGWSIAEVPVAWYERSTGRSRFRVLRWLPAYLRWFAYAFETTWLRKGPPTVRTRDTLPRSITDKAADALTPRP